MILFEHCWMMIVDLNLFVGVVIVVAAAAAAVGEKDEVVIRDNVVGFAAAAVLPVDLMLAAENRVCQNPSIVIEMLLDHMKYPMALTI